jgi:cyclophilin family peptidyl-prolyl cis-trans isomerase
MRRFLLLSAIIAGLFLVFMTACTPPPPPENNQGESGVAATNGETEAQGGNETATEPEGTEQTPTEGETTESGAVEGSETTDGNTTTGDTGESEDSSKGPDESDSQEAGAGEEAADGETTGGEEETMLAPEPVPDDIFGHYETWPPDSITDEEIDILRRVVVVFETTKGVMKIRLFPDQAPIHSANFVKLVQEGFYDGLTFHRVMENFMSQGGDPEGTGQGGPGYTLPAEIGLPHRAGSVAAARVGDQYNPQRRSSGSQFYICHTDESCARLNGAYTVYGQVVEGLDVNRSLSINYTNQGPIPGAETDSIIRAYIEMG